MLSYLKPMSEDDLSAVIDIETRAYDFPWTRQGFQNSLDQGLNYLFCDEQGHLLGYCCVLPVLDEAHLLNLCVNPDFHRQGIASAALNQLIDKLQESHFNLLLLEVRKSNKAAQCLYRKLGFKDDGIRKAYYRSKGWCERAKQLVEIKEDAVLMSLKINVSED